MTPFVPPLLPLDCLDWTKLVRWIGPSNAALARFDGILQGIVNPQILLSPLTIQEAVLSSRIEGTQASFEEVLHYRETDAVPAERRADIREVLNYRRALQESVEYLQKRPICLDLLRKGHSTLMEGVRGQERGRGQFRKVQNWIGRPDSTLQTARFVPPDPIVMQEALSNWERYLHFEEQDRLVQLAVIHAQFEIIHPFTDGNGRLGRMLLPLVLFHHGLLSSPMFYLSGYLERHQDAYFERLHRITAAGEWTEWVQFFLVAVTEQATENTTKAKEILALYNRMKQHLPEIISTQYTLPVIDALFDQPIFESTEFSSRIGVPKRSVLRILRALQDHEILTVERQPRGSIPGLLRFKELIEITGDAQT